MLNNFKYLKYLPALIKKDRISEVTFFITDICNMKCKHCFVLDALNKRLPILSPDEIRKMGKFVTPVQRVHVGGGEPFTRKDLNEVVAAISETWKPGVINVPTNGWFTDRILDFIDFYGQNCKSDIRIFFSINSPDPEDMDEFTKVKGSFRKWKESITKSIERASKYKHITIVALSTYNEHNQDIFKELIDYLHLEIKAPDFSFQIVRTHGDYKPDLDYHKFREMNNYYFDTYNSQDPFISSFRKLSREKNTEYFENPVFKKECISGKLRVVLSPTGDVYPCEKLGYPNLKEMNKWLLGNIRDFNYNLNELVSSTSASACHDKICSSKCHCDHNIDQSLSLLSDKKHRKELLRETLKKVIKK
jgi:radical SAM protein with 4Fe4S-binding SPASM domain